MSAGANLAGVIAPIFSAYVASLLGWQSVFHLLGITGLFLSAALVFQLKSSPEELGYRKEGMVYSSSNISDSSSAKGLTFSWNTLFFFKEFWLVTGLNVTFWIVKASIVDWLQLYLTEEIGKSEKIGDHLQVFLS